MRLKTNTAMNIIELSNQSWHGGSVGIITHMVSAGYKCNTVIKQEKGEIQRQLRETMVIRHQRPDLDVLAGEVHLQGMLKGIQTQEN